MTCGLVHASFSMPEWQAVKLTFFAPCIMHLVYPLRLMGGVQVHYDLCESKEFHFKLSIFKLNDFNNTKNECNIMVMQSAN